MKSNQSINAKIIQWSAIASGVMLLSTPVTAAPAPSHVAQDLQPPAPQFAIATPASEPVTLSPFTFPDPAPTAAKHPNNTVGAGLGEKAEGRGQRAEGAEQSSNLLAQSTPPAETPPAEQPSRPDLLETSPVFQQWNKEVPNVLDSIKRDPAFRTRARLGLSYFPTTFDSLGWNIGVEDVFIGKTGFTVSGDYQATFTGDRQAGGAELRYYLLPLGGYFNIAPVLGYRYLETPRYITDGLNVGAKFQAVLSRTGGADISFTQTWVDPRQSEEVGITKFSFGYALTKNLRLSTDIEKQNSKKKKDTRFGISFEWMF